MEVSITRADQRGSAPELLWQSRRRNTPLARHRRHLRIMRELARDLNLARPTEAERMLLSQAAALALQSERLRAAIVAGTTVDHESLVKLASEQRRAGLWNEADLVTRIDIRGHSRRCASPVLTQKAMGSLYESAARSIAPKIRNRSGDSLV